MRSSWTGEMENLQGLSTYRSMADLVSHGDGQLSG